MSGVSVLQHFEAYQKARVSFVQAVAEAATRPQNIEVMQNAGVMQLLRPLLLDNVPSIQQSAALALGRLANYSDDLAEAVVGNEILPQLVYSLSEQNRFYKKAAAFVLRAVAKHSADLAQAVVDCGALDALVPCLEEFDPTVKEAAAWAIGYIAQHTPELAQAVVDAGAVAYLAPLVAHPDAKLKRQVCCCLAQVAKHSVDLAEVAVEAEIFPNVLTCLKDHDSLVRKNAATCVREVAKHTPELAKLIVNSGGAAALVDYVADASGNAKLPGVMAIGYIAAFSETLALAIVVSKGVAPLKEALVAEPEDHLKAACAWSLGQVGRHTPDHARALAEGDVLRHLLACMVHPDSSEDLKAKAKRALKAVLAKCTQLAALQPLLRDSPIKVQKYVLRQFAQLLPHDVEARRAFVQNGGLQFLQELNETVGGKLSEYIIMINNCYPPEIVEYYSPNYSKTLLDKIDEFQPQA
mmetsp:Transcript_23590/g.35426  ORF Transcript_23590/g.35426 Transcript_23590/m.35426 type:complete len:467 (-) Transcript_23590:142-1542(-)